MIAVDFPGNRRRVKEKFIFPTPDGRAINFKDRKY